MSKAAAFTQEGGCRHPRRSRTGLRALWRQGELLMRFLCALLFLKFYAGVSSQCGVTSKELLTCPHPFPTPASEEGCAPHPRDLQGQWETLQRRRTWILVNSKSQCNNQAGVCGKEVG